jgi:hypothetical protein
MCLLLLACPSRGDELQSITGKILQGELISVDEKGVVLRGSNGKQHTPLSEILQIQIQREIPIPADVRYTDLELTDGTLIHCSAFAIKGKEIEAKLAVSGLSVRVPLAAITYLLNDAQEPAVRQEWQEKHVPRRGNQDLLAVKLNGVVNDLDGTFGDKESEHGALRFEYGGGDAKNKRDIDLTNFQVIQGAVFLRSPGVTSVPQLCKIHDVNQNVVAASKLELGSKSMTVTSASGLVVQYPRDGLARLDFSNDKIVYLSDLRPAETVTRSKQGRTDRLGIDRNLENGPIQIEGQVFGKGLAVHAHTELVYNIDGKYAKFEAVLGMDDTVGGAGKPSVHIEADGKELVARNITRKDKRQDLSCDIRGIKQIRIVVSSTGLLDFGDHVDLANARLSK